jgi:hypothetical protein
MKILFNLTNFVVTNNKYKKERKITYLEYNTHFFVSCGVRDKIKE